MTLTLDTPGPLNSNFTEGNSGDFTSFQLCFSALVDEPLGRFAVFQFNETNRTTATFGVDFIVNINSSFVVIGPDFAGLFSFCLQLFIIGDDQVEPDEVVDYLLIPLSEFDAVDLGGAASLRFGILDDDDGTYVGQKYQVTKLKAGRVPDSP